MKIILKFLCYLKKIFNFFNFTKKYKFKKLKLKFLTNKELGVHKKNKSRKLRKYEKRIKNEKI